VMTGTPDQVKAAIKAGADVNARQADSATALMYAAGANTSPEIIHLLLAAEGDINALSEGLLTSLDAGLLAPGDWLSHA
jgi:ankyrin repeat protein